MTARRGDGSRRGVGLAEMAGLFAIAACGLLVSVAAALDARSLPIGVAGAVLLAYGIITTLRLAVIAGFGSTGVAMVVALASLDPAVAMLVMAPTAVILVAVIPAIDVAFTCRRETVAHPTLIPGMVRVHLVAAVAGSAWALTVVALVALVEWPSVAIVAAMTLLAVASVATGLRVGWASRRLVVEPKR